MTHAPVRTRVPWSYKEAVPPDDRDVSLQGRGRRGQGFDTLQHMESVDAGRRPPLLPTPPKDPVILLLFNGDTESCDHQRLTGVPETHISRTSSLWPARPSCRRAPSRCAGSGSREQPRPPYPAAVATRHCRKRRVARVRGEGLRHGGRGGMSCAEPLATRSSRLRCSEEHTCMPGRDVV